jgi:uncharacterized membrane protein
MAEDFDRWLKASLEPANRKPDRAFAARVRAMVVLDERLRAAARATRRRLALEALALGATAVGAVLLARLPQFAGAISEAPEVAVMALLSGFALLVLLMSRDVPERVARLR